MDRSVYEDSENRYENDLLLAAELGKYLLERNKELELQLTQCHEFQDEQSQDLVLLAKQVEILREANESRMRVYEDVDKNAQELEKNSKRLEQELKGTREQLKSANDTIETLEQKCDELRTKLEQKYENERRSKASERLYNRTNSVPSLGSGRSPTTPREFKGFPSGHVSLWDRTKQDQSQREIKVLHDTIRTIKLQYNVEQRRRTQLEDEIEKLKEENDILIGKARELYDELMKKEEMRIKRAYKKDHEATSCAQCSSRAASVAGSDIADHSDFLEHDLDHLPRREVVRLRCGGSAFGSKESLNVLGLEAVTPSFENCGDILAFAYKTEQINQIKPNSDGTLLGELEEQYRKLVKKYEVLAGIRPNKDMATNTTVVPVETPPKTYAEAVKRRPKTLKLTKEVQTAWRKSTCGNIDFTSPLDPTEGHFECGPPEYKRLFKEIFETLRSAAVDTD